MKRKFRFGVLVTHLRAGAKPPTTAKERILMPLFSQIDNNTNREDLYRTK
jgi:hypothetical protein